MVALRFGLSKVNIVSYILEFRAVSVIPSCTEILSNNLTHINTSTYAAADTRISP